MQRDGNRVLISGRLTMDAARALAVMPFESDLSAGAQGRVLEVDLAQVEAVDSSAVSLLLVWLRQAKKNNVQLSYTHVPDNLRSLVALYGLSDALLPSG